MNQAATILISIALAFALVGTGVYLQDPDAQERGVSYTFYFQLYDGEEGFIGWSPTVEVYKCPTSFTTALKKVLASGGYSCEVSNNWIQSITIEGHEYRPDEGPTGSPFTGLAVYYADGKEWKATDDYSESDRFAIVIGDCYFEDPGSGRYLPSGSGYWAPAPLSPTVPSNPIGGDIPVVGTGTGDFIWYAALEQYCAIWILCEPEDEGSVSLHLQCKESILPYFLEMKLWPF